MMRARCRPSFVRGCKPGTTTITSDTIVSTPRLLLDTLFVLPMMSSNKGVFGEAEADRVDRKL
jgi:hypothetical protein